MPPPSSPSFLSLLLVLRSAVSCMHRYIFQMQRSHSHLYSHTAVCLLRPPLPLWLPGAPPERGAEPKNCLTTLCKLCVYSKARVTGLARLSTSHLLWMIKNLMLVSTSGYRGLLKKTLIIASVAHAWKAAFGSSTISCYEGKECMLVAAWYINLSFGINRL